MTGCAAIVMPVFNAASTVERALASILAQTVSPKEVIVVDDGSTDGSSALVESWAGRLPLKQIRHEKNCGIARSLIDGIEGSRASLILRLDADDEWLPNHVKTIVGLAAEYPDAALFSTRAEYVDANGNEIRKSREISNQSVRRLLMWDNPFVHSATAFRKDAYRAVGGYPVNVLWEDYRLWIELAAKGEVRGSPEVTIRYCVNPGSLSRLQRERSLADRRACQMLAVRRYFGSYPFSACATAIVVTMRRALNV